jgi:hypothetical protein
LSDYGEIEGFREKRPGKRLTEMGRVGVFRGWADRYYVAGEKFDRSLPCACGRVLERRGERDFRGDRRNLI